jgi:hypothetical protein
MQKDNAQFLVVDGFLRNDVVTCAICGEGQAVIACRMLPYEYLGYTCNLPTYYRYCATCTSDYAGSYEYRLAAGIIEAYKEYVDKLQDAKLINVDT